MLEIAIIIITIIIVAAILFAILKNIVKAVLFALGIAFLVFVIIGISVSIDAKAFQNNFRTSKNTFLLLKGETAIDGIEVDYNTNKTVDFTKEKLSEINSFLSKDELDKIKKDNYKIILIESENENEDIEEKFNEIFGNPITLIKNLKSEDVKIYPETTFLKVLKYVPETIINLVEKFKK